MHTALTIAGSDSGAGAGIQADLKTFAALGVYGTSALTAITAQNTMGVQTIYALPADCVALQIDSVLQDFDVQAVKTGMLSSMAIVELVADRLREYKARVHSPAIRLVVDPVMVAKSGDLLLREDARDAFIRLLLPLADVVTPNLAEAHFLSGIECESEAGMRLAAEAIFALGAQYVVVKGGHLRGSTDSVDFLYDGHQFREYRAPRIVTCNDHGTGCTFSSAIAVGLAKGLAVPQAVADAKEYLTKIMQASVPLEIGNGHGPLDHFTLLK